jgi:hypothetical protein
MRGTTTTVDVHQTADNDQKYVEKEQEQQGRLDSTGDKVYHPCRDLGINKVVGKTQRNAQDEEHTANKQPAFGQHPGDVT